MTAAADLYHRFIRCSLSDVCPLPTALFCLPHDQPDSRFFPLAPMPVYKQTAGTIERGAVHSAVSDADGGKIDATWKPSRQ